MSDSNPSATAGAHHLGLSVSDLEATQRFFQEGLGFDKLGEVPEYPAVFLSDGQLMLTLWRVEDPATAVGFDRRRVIGLHHLALRVASGASLDDIYARLKERDDVVIEFAPEPLGGGPSRHLMCHIPDGIRLELIAPASA